MRKTIKKTFFGLTSLLIFLPLYNAAAEWSYSSYQNGLPGGSVSDIIQKLLEWFLLIVGVIAVIAFLIAGILYLVSAGDEGKMETAKNAMIAGIIGIIVALSGFIALKAITTWLGGSSNIF